MLVIRILIPVGTCSWLISGKK